MYTYRHVYVGSRHVAGGGGYGCLFQDVGGVFVFRRIIIAFTFSCYDMLYKSFTYCLRQTYINLPCFLVVDT
jgi:hypothetical protein